MVAHTEEDDDSQEETVNYKAKYRTFKRKLKFLIYVSVIDFSLLGPGLL